MSSMFPSYLDNIWSPISPNRAVLSPALKGNLPPWIGSQNPGSSSGSELVGPFLCPSHEWVTPQGDTAEAREDPTGKKRQGKDDGKREGTSTEIYFLQKTTERSDFCS